MKRLNEKQTRKFAKNLLMFTAPALALFFGQLASGVDIKYISCFKFFSLFKR
jgi:hypothetical protein